MKTPSILLSRAGPSSWVISLLFMISAAYFYGEDVNALFRQSFYPGKTWSALAKGISNRTNEDVNLPFAVSSTRTKCDVFNGTWVRDEVSRPLYQESDCPYILTQLTCQKYGRPDKAYQNWRWQPHACSIQRFNATFMWEMLRNKRMMFVGDSLSHGQFISMVCLLHSAIPEKAKSMKQFDFLTVFRAENYNTTIEFYWAPFLLDSNADNTSIHRIKERIVRAGSIDKHSRHWKGVDILVFDTYIWWLTGYPMKIMRKSSEDKKVDIVLMEMDDAYRIAIKSLAKWVDNNVDPTRNRVFFTTMSPNHDKSQDWGRAPGGNCYNETSLIEDPTYWGSSSRKIIMRVIGEEFGKMMVPITLINITQLSEYRKDGHVSIYKKQYTPLTAEQLAKPASYSDCIHWCLPGVQDTWNELLYTKPFYP